MAAAMGKSSAGLVSAGGSAGAIAAGCAHCPVLSWWCNMCSAVLVLQVNIIPIIAKADTIAKNELHKFKSKIMSELVSNGVQIYQFPTDEETVAEINATMSVCLSLSSAPVAFCGAILKGWAYYTIFLLAFELWSEHRNQAGQKAFGTGDT